jgi:hypothetical protein
VGVRARLLATPPDRVSPDLARTVADFCAPVEVIRSAYIGLTEVTQDFRHPQEYLAVAFELAEPVAASEEGDRELRLVADRFYDTMPEAIVEGGCNFLEPGGITAWAEKAQRVFSRP